MEARVRRLRFRLVGGSPCQDFSSLRGPSRKGVKGKKSSIFEEIHRLHEIFQSIFSYVLGMLENVSSMPVHDRNYISGRLGVWPYLIEAAEVSPVRRSRFYWLLNFSLSQDPELQFELVDGVYRCSCSAVFPPLETFLLPNTKPRLSARDRFPAFTRPIPKDSAPKFIAGIKKAEPEAIRLYTENRFRYQPY